MAHAADSQVKDPSADIGGNGAASGAGFLNYDSDAFVRETIGKLRTRLLDLTTRNPLISFKHSSRTRRHIRVVDELPDNLYSRLESDSKMRFRSLGEEPSEPDDAFASG